MTSILNSIYSAAVSAFSSEDPSSSDWTSWQILAAGTIAVSGAAIASYGSSACRNVLSSVRSMATETAWSLVRYSNRGFSSVENPEESPRDAAENYAALYPEHANQITEGLVRLKEEGILTPENRAALIQHPEHANQITEGLVRLKEEGILTPENRAAVLQDPKNAGFIASGVTVLETAGIPTADNLAAVTQSGVSAKEVALAIVLLYDSDDIVDENRESILQHPEHARELAHTIIYLRNRGCLTPENRESILQCPEHAAAISRGIVMFQSAEILNEDNRAAILQHPEYAMGIARAFICLNNSGYLTADSRAAVVSDPGIAEVVARRIILPQANVEHRQPGRFVVDGARLAEDHIEYLLKYCARVKANNNRLPGIKYVGSEGIDAGGLTRDFMTKLFIAISENSENMTTEADNHGKVMFRFIAGQEESQMKAFDAIGRVFAHALVGGSFTVGERFSRSMFLVMRSLLQHAEIPATFEEFTNPENPVYVEAMKVYLLNEFPDMFKSEDDVIGFLGGDKLPAGIDTDSRLDLIDNFNESLFASASISIAMRDQLLQLEMSADDIAEISAKKMSESIQGTLSHKQVLDSLEFRGDAADVEVNLRSWIEGLSIPNLKKFVWLVSGSEALHPDTTLLIRVFSGMDGALLPTYHTCSKKVHIPAYPDLNTLQARFNTTLEHLDGFQIA